MALSPQKFREITLQILYSQELAYSEKDDMIELMMNELSVSKKNVRLAQEKALQIRAQLSTIDQLIASVSTSYDFERIQTVTKNILRLAVFELFFERTTPPKVVIAEAIRLSRKFSTPESASFVNALIDHLYQASQGQKVDPHQIGPYFQAVIESEKIASDITQEKSIPSSSDETS